MLIDYRQIIDQRNTNFKRLMTDPVFLSASKIYYKTNPAQFIIDWGFTYDPRNREMATLPFNLFPKQVEYIEWLYDRLTRKEDGITEKSRDMGLTWLTCAFAVWAWLFCDEIKISFGSRKEKLVDDLGNLDSIFEKIRMYIRNVPAVFLPYYTNANGQKKQYEEKKDATYLKIINHQTGSSITGEAGDNVGRGGRSTLYFVDEAAFIPRFDSVLAALSQNSDVKIYVSTPNGTGNAFYRMRVSDEYPVFTFHWRDDPRKDQAWYDNQKKTLDPVIVAQEIDIDYAAAVDGICIPSKWVKAAIDYDKKTGIKPTGQRVCGFDVADEGGDKNAHVSRKGYVVDYIHEWSGQGITIAQSTQQVYAKSEQFKSDLINFDNIGVGSAVKSTAIAIRDNRTNPIRVLGVNAGSTDRLKGFWSPGKKKEDMFTNNKALMWWSVRQRFQKTYERAEGIQDHPIDQCISIPRHHDLILELSQPRYFFQESGKIMIEKKEQLAKRGIPSHNLADAFVLAFCPPSVKTIASW